MLNVLTTEQSSFAVRGGGIAIDVDNVTKRYGGSTALALDAVSVTVMKNEFFTLLGPSGCGKTTLLRLIAGFEYPTGGQLKLDGEDLALLPANRRPVNTVFQNYALFPHMTVAQNIAFGLEMLGKSRDEISRAVAAMLQLVRLEEFAERKPSQLSGGQQQRVALARALAPRPKILLLDEPLSALDYKLRKEMQAELKRLQQQTGITFIFVTHDQEEALTMSDRIAVMSRGNILQVASPEEIYETPANRTVAEFIGESNFLAGRVQRNDDGAASLVLPDATSLPVSAAAYDISGNVTAMVRPENIEIVTLEAQSDLRGEIADIVYFGTDTHFHIALASGEQLMVRHQNGASRGRASLRVGDSVGLRIAPGSLRILG